MSSAHKSALGLCSGSSAGEKAARSMLTYPSCPLKRSGASPPKTYIVPSAAQLAAAIRGSGACPLGGFTLAHSPIHGAASESARAESSRWCARERKGFAPPTP
eukprot:scaffold44040_cov69-Phaeocystis_antarctica.AAC.6